MKVKVTYLRKGSDTLYSKCFSSVEAAARYIERKIPDGIVSYRLQVQWDDSSCLSIAHQCKE